MFIVNSPLDRSDTSPGDGMCRTSQGVCTLRAAIIEANALAGADTIQLPAGVFEIEIPTLNTDAPETGDFDIFGPLTLYGPTAGVAVIDGGFPLPGSPPTQPGIDRLFEIHPGAGDVTFLNLTLREGFSVDDGGAIQNWSSGLLRVENVSLLKNMAQGSGGAINNGDPADYTWATAPLTPPPPGQVEIIDSTLSGNAAASGAAVNNVSSGAVAILNSQVVDNPGQMIPDPLDPTSLIPAPGVYTPGGGAIANEARIDTVGTLRVTGSTVARNYSTSDGAGIYNGGSSVLVVENATVSDNIAEGGGAGVYINGGTVSVTGSTIEGNEAHDGGGLYSAGALDGVGLRSRVTISGSTIRRNKAEASGGGLANGGDAYLNLTDVTFDANHAGDAGGGLENGRRASMTLTRVRFTGNEANGEGGGAWTGAERLTVIADSYFLANKAGVPTPEDLANPGGANTAGGGGLYTENGPVTISGSGFANNSATEEGGGISIDNFGDVTLRNSVVRFNRAGADGGGIENSGTRVTFDRLTVSNNRSELDGGGIYNSSSGEFTILDTTIELNSGLSGGGLANAPDGDLIMRRSLIYRNTARNPGFVEGLPAEEGGIGGGIFSLADGDALIENSTISGNTAARGGGGLFHDADGEVRIVNSTFWRNAAPLGGAIGVMESDFVPTLPPSPVLAVVLRNTIVGGSTSGGSCDYYISTEGGNLDTTTGCFLSPTPDSDSGLGGRDRHSASFTVDAIADNGGATLTHALRAGTIAVDGGANPCVETDARGVTRPQNSRCDIGAYEYVGAPAPPDSIAPDTQYLSGPVQNSLETVAFTFSGSDAGTGAADLQFECRLLETDLAEAPDLLPPWMPVPPELMWLPCSSPWSVPLVEEGLFNFEVRAIDRADNIDPTPAVHTFNGADTSPPNTSFIETPPTVSNSRTATFTFAGSDNLTPPQFLEFECRLDSRDPDMWVECLNPTFFSNLTSGEHILEVRALDGSELIDPTPARYTWTVGQLPNCNAANITLTATADAWVDEVNQLTNFLFYNQLEVRSGATGDPTAVPPVPVVGENARALVRFALPTDAPSCVLEAATLRLYNDSPTEGRVLQARPLGASWLESTVNWSNQPATLGSTNAVTSPSRSGPGYQEWDVTAHVQAMRGGGLNHGWQIRDAVESDLTGGGDQSYASRELPQDPPEITLPQLVLRYEADAAPAPPPPTPATTPTTVVCGQVLTQSTLVANDLTNCPGEGLVVGASNIVVDLNGHTIDGPNYLLENVSGQEEGFPAGIRVSGKTNVIVRNGTVQEFGYGVQLTSGTTRSVVDDITALRNAAAGVELFDADDGRTGNTVQNSTINDNELGVALVAGSENSIVRNNTIGGNLGEQIFIQYSSGHLLENNIIHGIPSDPLLDSDGGVLLDGASQNVFSGGSIRDTGDAGIVISAGSNHNMVQGVAMYRNGDAGVIINDSEHNQVIDVVSHQQSDGGIVLNNAHDTVVRDSDLRYNPSGVEAGGSNNIVIENNDGSDSLQAGFEVGNGLNIQIIGNTAHRTGGSGISLESGAFDASGNPLGGALIAGNYTDENRGDGISASDGGHTIRNNTAYNNAGFGIRAGEALAPGEVPGPGINIDGGGNIASGNAEPEQCIGVVCAGGATPPVSSADSVAPVTLILTAPISPTGSLDATFVFSATDNVTPLTGMVFECRIDPPPDLTPEPEPVDPEPPDPGAPPEVPEPIEGEGWAACVSPITYSGLEPGLHHFEVRALDQAEPPNKDLTPAAHDWVIDPRIEEEETGSDTVAPETRISAAPDSPTTATSATFRFTGSDNSTPGLQLTFECSLNGAAYTSCLTPLTYASLGAGNHTFNVRARDRSGNLDPSPATHSWTVIVPPQDTTAPETTIATGPDGVTVSTTATFTFSSNELGARFECSLNGGTTWATCTSPATFTSLAVGNRELRVRAIDEANNVDASPAIYAWTISAAPVLTTVSCGQVITRSILLRNNLSDCQWDGIVVGAPGITIDLNGKLVDGKGLAAGIRNDGHDNVTIKNGRVEDFDYGVMLNIGTVGNYVEKITARNNQEAGVALGHVPPPAPNQPTPQPPPPSFQSGVSGNIVRNNTLTANDVGIWLINAARANLITNNVISATPSEGIWVERAHENQIVSNVVNATSGAGIGLIGARSNTIANNTLSENGGGIRLGITDSSSGSLPSNNNIVQGNTVNESNGDGIEVIESAGNQLLDNSATFANGEGVSLYNASANLVRGNDLRNNKGGISLIGSSDNRLEGNDASESDSDGISLQSLSVNNELIRNISSNNSSDGIYIGDETSGEQGMLLDGNITNNNVGYGIYISKVSHVIKNNIANDNDSWGIWASEGSNGRVNIDGGGNRAQGNLGPLDPFTLKPLQCYSVQCDGGPTVSADEIPPDTLLIETPPNPSNAYSATFRFTGSDNASSVSFECQVDGGAWSACTSPASYVLPVGMRNFKVRAVDIAGNIDQNPASYVWTITTPPSGAPETTINSGPDAVTVSTSASFTFSANEAGSTFQCALDGGAFVACDSPASYTGLSVGAHSFQVRATDQGNETDTSPASFSWTIGAAPVPATVGCGQILVQSTRVLNNLIDCGGHGLIVGANGITIDLNGHFIDGIGLEAGILNNGFDNVTISNGAISNFDYGVLLNPGTAGNVVTGLRLELNQEAGIALSDADQAGKGNTVRENTIVSNANGVALFSNTSNAVVRDNAIGANSGDGVRLEFASNNQILANEIANSSGDGIVIEGGAGNTIIGNTLSANMGAGIAVGAELLAANNSRVESNTISGGASGISVVDSTGVQVLYNTIRGTSGAAIALDLARTAVVRGNDTSSNQSGIALSESSNNRIEANNASDTLGSGIEIGSLSFSNQVLDNAASLNAGEGIHVTDPALASQGNVVEGNTADSNGGDGIAVDGVGHTLADNTARTNGGWGIYVAVSASDGGGNFAAGNVEAAQCLNIVCTLGTVAGTPETWIIAGPVDVDTGAAGIQSNSRNASFTYNGSDNTTAPINMIFECRIDSTNDLAWQDCEYPAEALNLSAGPHVFEVRAVDIGLLADPTPARYEWTYVPLPAGIAPVVTLDIVPEAASFTLDALFTFFANEPDVTFECKVDLFGYEPCGFEGAAFMSRGAFEWGLQETEVGLHTFYVRAIDFEGNVGAPTTFTWRLLGVVTLFTAGPGFTPPETPEDPPTGGPVRETTATIEFTSNVADATFECSLDLAPFAPCTSPVTYNGLLEGSHELRVVATDTSTGLTEAEAAVYEWEVVEFVDTAPPDTTIERAPASNSSDTTFEFTGTDGVTPPALLSFECRVDSASELDWQACVSPFNLLDLFTYQDPQLAPGQHTFEVRAIDNAEPVDPNAPQEGNVDPTPASYTWTMIADTVPPGTGILTTVPATIGTGAAVDVEFFGSDNATPVQDITFECAVDLGLFVGCTSPESLQGLEPGAHTFRVRAVDLAGNVDATPATRSFTVVPAPITMILTGPAGRILPGASAPPLASTTEIANFTFSANQAGSTFACSLDGAPFVVCTSPRGYTISASGTHSFEVRATNPEGVVEEPPAVYEWLVELGPDVTPPNTSITAWPSNPSTSTVATFGFTGNDTRTPIENLVFECAIDGNAYSSCTSPQQFSDLVRGTHTVLIRARDLAGNFDPTPASYTWVVELPPVTSILTGPAEYVESTSATFTFAADVPGSTFQCWLDGTITPCTSPVTYNTLPAGDHLFAVLATAPNGTLELAWAEWEWRITDITPPIVTITSGPAVTTQDTSTNFVFSANEPGVTYTCALDGRPAEPCTPPVNFPRLHPGAHSFAVTAFSPPMLDALGQPVPPLYEPTPTVYEWTIIDLVAPETAIMYGPAATTASTSAYFGFTSDDPLATIECSLDGAVFSSCETPYELTDLAVGSHTLVARAVDLAGNVDATPEVYPWTIVAAANNTAVGTNISVSLPIPGSTGSATITFAEVTAAGATTIDALTGGPTLPGGYSVSGGRYYDISTTALYGQPVTLCLTFDPLSLGGVPARLLHFDGSLWIDIATLSDPSGQVCGEPESFSPFALAVGSGLAPIASIASGPPNPSTSGTATFTFFADQPEAVIQCSLDGLPFENCASPITYTQLETGGHDFQIQAIGVDGQAQLIPSIYEWEVVLTPDTTPPDTEITVAAPPLTANFINTFEFSGSDDQTLNLELSYECALNGGIYESCSTPEEIVVLAAGVYTLTVRAIDDAGNVDPTPASHTWQVVDFLAPDTTIDLGPNSETTETSAVFEFSGEEANGDPVSAFECALDTAEFATCTSPYTVTNLDLGAHVLLVRAVSAAGTVDPSPDFYEWLIIGPPDTTTPDTFIVSGPPAGNSGPDVTFGFASDEPVSEFECQLDAGLWVGCDAAHELIGLAPGQHILLVRAIDAAEIPNVDPTPAEYIWTTLGEPDTIILSGPPALTSSLSATFTFTTTQEGATFQCSLDGSLYVACTSPFVAGPLLEDTHQFEVHAVNQFVTIEGEQVADQTPATYTWEVQDATPPDTTVVSAALLGPNDLVEPNSWRFQFAGEDNRTAAFELSFECALDSGLWSGCDALYYLPLEGLAGGDHVLAVRAVDEMDNVDPTPATHTFTVEGEPQTTILTGPLAETDSTSATFTFTADQTGATFECSLDLAPFAPCASGVTFTSIPYGEHELAVRAVSPLGTLTELTPAEYIWTSGFLTAPDVTIVSGPAATTLDTTATFTFGSTDTAALFQCSLDGSAPVFCTSGVSYSNLLGGEHTFEVVATKANLLVEPVAATWIWTVGDQTLPDTTIVITPGLLVALDTPASFTFASNEPDAGFECALDGGLFEPCAGPPPTNTAEFSELRGEHTLLVRAVDPSLNADPTPESFTWTVVAPPETVISGPATPVLSTTATFEFVDQPGSTYVCAIDSPDSVNGFTACTSPYSASGLADGAHVFEVRATNLLGELETPAARFNFSVIAPDTVAPTVSLELTPPATTVSTAATFIITGTDNRTLPEQLTFECSLDGAAFAGCGTAVELNGLAVASHTLAVRSVDLAGNTSAAASFTWTVTAPGDPNTPAGTGVSVPVTLPGSTTTTATITFTGVTAAGYTAIEASGGTPILPAGYLQVGATFYDISTSAVYNSPVIVCINYTPGSLAEPVRLLHFENGVWADVTTTSDPDAGLVCGEPEGLSPFAVASGTAAVVPETTIVSGPPASTISTFADFTFSSNDPLATFQCSFDALNSWGSCPASATFASLSPGEHTLRVRAVNALGTFDASAASSTWTVLALPETVIVTGPTDPTESTSATFTFTSTDPLATFECALDDAPGFLPCESGITYDNLAFGEHELRVRAKDVAGNVDPTPDNYDWSIGNIPAPVTINSSPDALTESTTASFVFSADEQNPTFECSLDGALFAPCNSPTTYAGLPVGLHTFQVRVLDPNAVAEAPITTYSWTIAAGAP